MAEMGNVRKVLLSYGRGGRGRLGADGAGEEPTRRDAGPAVLWMSVDVRDEHQRLIAIVPSAVGCDHVVAQRLAQDDVALLTRLAVDEDGVRERVGLVAAELEAAAVRQERGQLSPDPWLHPPVGARQAITQRALLFPPRQARSTPRHFD